MVVKKNFIGSGWKFPPTLDARGRIELAHQEQDVVEAVRMILLTRKGERPMRPEFGSELYKLVFMPNDAATAGLARRYVFEALDQWEPRIRVTDVIATITGDQSSTLMLHIDFTVIATNSDRNLVFPFYTIPGED